MKTAGKRKITTGYVVQVFDQHNNCIEQEFVAGDDVAFEGAYGEVVDSWSEYHPFYMIQPEEPAAKYIRGEGRFCPHCASINLAYGEADEQTSAVYRPVRCTDCNKEWTETLTLTGVNLDG